MSKKTIGITLIILPFAIIMLIFAAYAVMSFLVSVPEQMSDITSNSQVFVLYVRTILGAIGVLSVFGMIVFPIIGVYYLSKHEGEKLEEQNKSTIINLSFEARRAKKD